MVLGPVTDERHAKGTAARQDLAHCIGGGNRGHDGRGESAFACAHRRNRDRIRADVGSRAEYSLKEKRLYGFVYTNMRK